MKSNNTTNFVRNFTLFHNIKVIMIVVISGLLLFGTGNATAVNANPDIKINEILYSSGTAGLEDPQFSIEWVEIFNAGPDSQNLLGWTISNYEGTANATLPNWDLPSGSYLTIHFGVGNNDNDFSDKDGHLWTGIAVEVFDDNKDECALYSGTPSGITIIDFVAWSVDGDPLSGISQGYAVSAGIWGEGEYVNTASLMPVDTLGRYLNGFDNNIPDDWRIYDWLDYISNGITQPENPVQISPEKYLIIDNTAPDFDWVDVPNIDSYRFQVDNDTDFSSPEIDQAGLTNSEFTPSTPLSSDIYFFRINGAKGGNETHWSAEWIFAIDGGDLILVSGGDSTLSIPFKWQRKDTNLLCIWDVPSNTRPGCEETGSTSWDAPHPDGPPNHPHDDWYCVRASIAMLNARYGGDLSQDRISYQIFKAHPPIGPEGDLGHEMGTTRKEIEDTLSWALNDAAINHQIAPVGGFTFAQMKGWIENLDGFVATIPGHAIVPDGYAELSTPGGKLIQALYVHDPARGPHRRKIYSWVNMNVPPPNDNRAWDHDFTNVFLQPSVGVTARMQEASVTTDTDGDGLMDFDETERFKTSPNDQNTDHDCLKDKQEVRSYTFRIPDGNSYIANPDVDMDGMRPELDPDSDNGGSEDGAEDRDGDGKYEPTTETDPFIASDDKLPIECPTFTNIAIPIVAIPGLLGLFFLFSRRRQKEE